MSTGKGHGTDLALITGLLGMQPDDRRIPNSFEEAKKARLVEIPCVKRNVIGAVGTAAAANMALAGIVGHIPPDEAIDSMGEVGRLLPSFLRETGKGGLANTPTEKE